jgi:hypothetical protein
MILYSLIAFTIILNIGVSRHVYLSSLRLGYEKVAEIGLIWVLPIMGALVSLCITYQSPARVREYENINRFFCMKEH